MPDDDRIKALAREATNELYRKMEWTARGVRWASLMQLFTDTIRMALGEAEKAKPGWGGVTQMLLKQQKDKVHEIMVGVEEYKKQTEAQLAGAREKLEAFHEVITADFVCADWVRTMICEIIAKIDRDGNG